MWIHIICFLMIFKVNAQNMLKSDLHIDGYYNVTENIIIEKYEDLIIEAGSVINFQGNFSITIHGRLLAHGQKDNPIIFTSSDTSGFTNLNIPDGGWLGIRFMDENDGSISRLEHCIIEFAKITETSGLEGGAIYTNNYHNLDIWNCIIRNNYARVGGGILCNQSDIEISHCIIYNNKADYGAGIFCSRSDVDIYNNLIYKNEAIGGGGITFQFCSYSLLLNNTICFNKSYYQGAGIQLLHYSNPEFQNNIIYYNQVYGINNQISMDENCMPSFINCDIQNGASGFLIGSVVKEFTGTYISNIEDIPLFKDYLNDDYMIDTLSPCIDAGLNNKVDYVKDLDDHYRIFDGDNDINSVVDIGAYEFGSQSAMIVNDTAIVTSSRFAEDGQIIINIENGIGPFFIRVYDDVNYDESLYTDISERTVIFNDLPTGNYYIYVSDVNDDVYTNKVFVGFTETRRFSISGTVKYPNIPIDYGIVVAYKVVDKNYIPSYLARVEKGKYEFDEMDSAMYILQAIPYQFNYSVYPVFYPKEINWQDAYIIDVYGLVYDVDFELDQILYDSPMNSLISGTITFESDNKYADFYNRYWYADLEQNLNSKNAGNNIVVLVIRNGIPSGWFLSSYGSYSIGLLSTGDYNLIVQIPGYSKGNDPVISLNNENGDFKEAHILLRNNDIMIYTENSEITSDKIDIWPNPFNSTIKIKFDYIKSLDYNITFYDNTGRKVYNKDLKKEEMKTIEELKLENLNTGIYNCIVKTGYTINEFKVVKIKQ